MMNLTVNIFYLTLIRWMNVYEKGVYRSVLLAYCFRIVFVGYLKVDMGTILVFLVIQSPRMRNSCDVYASWCCVCEILAEVGWEQSLKSAAVFELLHICATICVFCESIVNQISHPCLLDFLVTMMVFVLFCLFCFELLNRSSNFSLMFSCFSLSPSYSSAFFALMMAYFHQHSFFWSCFLCFLLIFAVAILEAKVLCTVVCLGAIVLNALVFLL